MIFFELDLIRPSLKIFFFLTCFLTLQSCAGSKVGEKLAESFDAPLESDNSTKVFNENKQIKDSKLERSSKLNEKNASPSQEKKELISLKKSKNIVTKKNQKTRYDNSLDANFKPQTYRVILKVPGANPSAPAERVTSALRNAGVTFEIEIIELYERRTLINNSSNR